MVSRDLQLKVESWRCIEFGLVLNELLSMMLMKIKLLISGIASCALFEPDDLQTGYVTVSSICCLDFYYYDKIQASIA